MKTQHGGLTGTEDTGYNDDDMNMFLKRDVALLAMESQIQQKSTSVAMALERDDFDVDQYELMLKEHRNQVLIDHIEDS
jgi:hypothetical protein